MGLSMDEQKAVERFKRTAFVGRDGRAADQGLGKVKGGGSLTALPTSRTPRRFSV